MPSIEIYSKDRCPSCDRAKAFFDQEQLPYTVYAVDKDEAALVAMRERAPGRNTVPQIFINGHHVGGWDDLFQLTMDDRLNALLQDEQ